MRYHRLALTSVLLAGFVGAATLVAQQEPVDRAVVARIQTEATQRSKLLETFNYITNVTGGRLTGSRAHKQAADYLRDRLAEWGMTNPHLSRSRTTAAAGSSRNSRWS